MNSNFLKKTARFRFIAFLGALVLSGPWVSPSFGQATSPVLTHQTFTIPRGTSYVGVAILKPAVLRGSISAVAATNQISVQVSETAPGDLSKGLFLEITACPRDPTLEGERYSVPPPAAALFPASGPLVLTIRSSPENSRTDLPPGLAGASFAVYPVWTLKDIFGGGGAPPRLRAGPILAASDTVTVVHSFGQSTYWLKPSPKGSFEWNLTTRALAQGLEPVLPPGAGLIVRKTSRDTLRFSLAGERRQHLYRRPLRAGSNFLSLPCLEHASIQDLALTPDQGWSAGDTLKIWNGWTFRRFQRDATNGRWQSLDADLGDQVDQLPLLAPDRAFVIEKAAPDPDFAVRPPPVAP